MSWRSTGMSLLFLSLGASSGAAIASASQSHSLTCSRISECSSAAHEAMQKFVETSLRQQKIELGYLPSQESEWGWRAAEERDATWSRVRGVGSISVILDGLFFFTAVQRTIRTVRERGVGERDSFDAFFGQISALQDWINTEVPTTLARHAALSMDSDRSDSAYRASTEDVEAMLETGREFIHYFETHYY
jgi:hypothetical protein